jgi:hypothetical protein
LEKTRRTSRRVGLFLARSRELGKDKANLSPGRLVFGKVPRTWKKQGELLAGSACFWQGPVNLEKTRRTSRRVGLFLTKSRELGKIKANFSPGRLVFGKVSRTWKKQAELLIGSACFRRRAPPGNEFPGYKGSVG